MNLNNFLIDFYKKLLISSVSLFKTYFLRYNRKVYNCFKDVLSIQYVRMNKKIIYPTMEKVIEYNILVLNILKVKKAD